MKPLQNHFSQATMSVKEAKNGAQRRNRTADTRIFNPTGAVPGDAQPGLVRAERGLNLRGCAAQLFARLRSVLPRALHKTTSEPLQFFVPPSWGAGDAPRRFASRRPFFFARLEPVARGLVLVGLLAFFAMAALTIHAGIASLREDLSDASVFHLDAGYVPPTSTHPDNLRASLRD